MSKTNNSICDQSGNLLFFSNGCGIMDSAFHLVPGAEKINNAPIQDYQCKEIGGERIPNGLLILPMPCDTEYAVIHERWAFNYETVEDVSDRIMYTKVVQTPQGLRAYHKDSIIVDDYVYQGGLTACKHANGRDWWVASAERYNNNYYLLLVTPDGISVQKDSIGKLTNDFEDQTGEAVFSPDGTKYARYTISADLQIFDFDRCAGDFSNPIYVPIVDAADTSWAAGVAFSPNSRYLYVSSTYYIYQFDMWATDIPASKTTVAVYDGYYDGYPSYPTIFHLCELGPDNKIYISCAGGKKGMHVIEKPDLPGLACHVVQHKYDSTNLAFPIIGGLPHHPNYRLGALEGSGCDTIVPVGVKGSVQQVDSERLVVWPNPASAQLSFRYWGALDAALQYALYSVQGQMLRSGPVLEVLTRLDVQGLVPGVYYLSVFSGKGRLPAVKVVIAQH